MAYTEFDEEAFKQRLINGGIPPTDAAEVAAATAVGRRNGPPKALLGSALSTDPLDLIEAPDPLGIIEATRARAAAQASQSADMFADQANTNDRTPAAAQDTPGKKPAGIQKVRKMTRTLKSDLSARQRNLIDDALAIEQEEARAAGAVGYMVRTLAQATLPHLDPKLPPGMMYSRDTGQLTLTVSPTSPKHGIPYGSIPRLIMAWLCTEVVQNKERILDDRTISLGKSQAEFLTKKLRMHSNGNDIRRFREQSLRLFKSTISVEYSNDQFGDISKRLMISDKSSVFWHPRTADQESLWDSTLDVTESFIREVLAAPVPIDMRVFHSLSKSPMAMDIYTWFTYRMFILVRSGKSEVHIPWAGLQAQIGSRYGQNLKTPDEKQAMYSFKSNFKTRFNEVLNFYPEAQGHVEDTGTALKLTPCQLHLPHWKALTK